MKRRFPQWPDAKSARAFALLIDGLTYTEIAAVMGLTRSAVCSYMTRHGAAELRAEGKIRERQVDSYPAPDRDTLHGSYPFEAPARRPNDDHKHLTLMLAALRAERYLADGSGI